MKEADLSFCLSNKVVIRYIFWPNMKINPDRYANVADYLSIRRKTKGKMMSETTEKIELKCPICKEIHEYSITVNQSCVVYGIIVSTPSQSESTVKRFKRTFICPKKNELFQAIVTIEEGDENKINDVSVKE